MKRGIGVILVILAATSFGLLNQRGVINSLDTQRLPAATQPSTIAASSGDAEPFEPRTVAAIDERQEGAEAVPSPAQLAAVPEKGELGPTKEFLKVVCEVQNEPAAQSLGFDVRHYPLDLRERLFAALYAAERKLPQSDFQQSSRPAWKPDCQDPNLSRFLTGQLRSSPATLIDLPSGMGGGPELDFLEIRLMEMQGIADLMVIAETSISFRGDHKPRAYQLNAQRFQAFKDWVLYLDLEKCPQYWEGFTAVMKHELERRDIWSLQNKQRECLWDMFFQARPDLPDDTLVIFSDLDEIPNGQMMMSLKHCEWKTPKPEKIQFNQHRVQFNLREVFVSEANCLARDRWRQGGLFHLGWAKKTLKTNHQIPLRYRMTDTPEMIGGAIHLNYFGHALSLLMKQLQHGEQGFLYFPPFIIPCNVTDKDVLRFLAIVRDNPVTVARFWENKSQPMKQAIPRPQDLQKCQLPWALQANPRRYAAFWGQALSD